MKRKITPSYKERGEVLQGMINASMIKEAQASCSLDDCTQCGTIEPKTKEESKTTIELCLAQYEKGKAGAINKMNLFILDRTALCGATESKSGIHIIKFMPFEWEDFKKEINKEEKT